MILKPNSLRTGLSYGWMIRNPLVWGPASMRLHISQIKKIPCWQAELTRKTFDWALNNQNMAHKFSSVCFEVVISVVCAALAISVLKIISYHIVNLCFPKSLEKCPPTSLILPSLPILTLSHKNQHLIDCWTQWGSPASSSSAVPPLWLGTAKCHNSWSYFWLTSVGSLRQEEKT